MTGKRKNLNELYSETFKAKFNYFKGSFSFHIEADIKTLFGVLSNTSSVNKYLGFAPREEREVDGKVLVSTRFLGMDQEWVENPWRWSSGRYIISERDHLKGPYTKELVIVHIEPSATGFNVHFQYESDIKYFWLKKLIDFTFAGFGKNYEKAIRELCENSSLKTVRTITDLERRGIHTLENLGVDRSIAEKMSQLLYASDDDEVFKIRLPELALKWVIELDRLIEPFLIASKNDLLEICWDVLCPHCKGSRTRALNLNDLIYDNKCDPCEYTFSLDDIDSIDVTFKLHPKIREVKEISFCAAEPHKKQHIIFQDKIESGSEVTIFHSEDGDLGLFRCRVLGQKQEALFKQSIGRQEPSEVTWDCESNLIFEDCSREINLKIINNAKDTIIVIFEKVLPPQFYLSPLKIFNSDFFKTQYQDQKIARGVQLKLPVQVILFTDVVDSTKLYQKLGDAEAFRQIQNHFEIISSLLKKHDGIQIKSIGDAVMATFGTIEGVFKAAKEMCEKINADEKIIFKIRLSVHKGSVIAVNYNTGIDYFGNNVNLSAKLQAIANADEISMSEEIFEDFSLIFPKVETDQRVYLDDKNGHVVNIHQL